MFTVRYVSVSDPSKPANCRDRQYGLKREALAAMRQLFAGNTRGATFQKARISWFPKQKLYVIEVPKP